MTDPWGVDAAYLDAHGVQKTIAPEVLGRVRDLVGRRSGPDRRPLFVRRDEATRLPPGVLHVEGGGSVVIPFDGSIPPDLPFGYHELHPAKGDAPLTVIAPPSRCHLPEDWRAWGWVAQLYATRSSRSWGIGDLADLARLATWSARAHGAGFVMVNPLHAAGPTTPQEASPYSPTSRRFLNPLSIRVEDVPGSGLLSDQLEVFARLGRALDANRLIDRDAVLDLKMSALELIWERIGDRAVERERRDFEQWSAEQGDGLSDFATWSVLAERLGPDWRAWPEEYRRPRTGAVDRFAADHRDRIRFHGWLQWLASAQLRRAASEIRVVQDLPIGFAPGGADAWSWQDLLAQEVSVGAPPDEFNTAGQDWGLPPFVPWKLSEAGYRPFIETVRATMPAGGGLRVDHIMGLFRLWWIPQGSSPRDGAYVRYPSRDLLDIVALESHRRGAVVIGEDLGTVEPGVREAMAARSMLTYRLLWFEPDDPSAWPRSAMAAVTTHDLPTVAGIWERSDSDELAGLGLDPNTDGWEKIRGRVQEACALADDAEPADAVRATYGLLARAPSVLLAATLDDACAEPRRPNVPGTTTERPNWCLALPQSLEEIEESPLAADIAATLRSGVTQSGRTPG